MFNEVFYLNGRSKKAFENPFLFDGLTAQHDSIRVNTRGKKMVTVKQPQVIITINSNIMELDVSIISRVKLIESEIRNGIFTFKKLSK